MIIDFHTHVFPDKIAQRAIASLVKGCQGAYNPCTNGRLCELTQKMQEFKIDLSVVMPVVTSPSQTQSINLWAKEITDNEKIISFGGIHPATDDYKRDIDFVASLGLKGIKLHPEYQQFELDAPEMLKIYDYALSKGLILMFHAGFDPAYPPPIHSSPKQFKAVSEAMRGGSIIAAHLGGQKQWDDVEKYIVGTDILIDTSMGSQYYPKEQFLRIVKNHGADKILFGTDSPWSCADGEIAFINSLPLSDIDKDKIFYKNAQRLLKI